MFTIRECNISIKNISFTMYYWVYFNVILSLLCTIQLGDVEAHATLICRNCGHAVTHSSMLINQKSVLSLNSYNMTVFGRSHLIQVFQNPTPQTFNVITASTADLQLTGKAYLQATWFPDHEWTICVCSKCGKHLGWYFQSVDLRKESPSSLSTTTTPGKSSNSFVGLVLDNLISDDYADTLTRVP